MIEDEISHHIRNDQIDNFQVSSPEITSGRKKALEASGYYNVSPSFKFVYTLKLQPY